MALSGKASTWFSFIDRSLRYDCITCGSQCCKGAGLALDSAHELVRFARLEPRMATLLRVMGQEVAQPLETRDGCWFLEDSGLCAIETGGKRDDKPSVCLLFPFNRVFRIQGVRVVDVNLRLCPLEDALATGGNGQAWDGLLGDLDAAPDGMFSLEDRALPPGAPNGFLALEGRLRDGAAAYLDEPDYAACAAWQEETIACIFEGRPLPQPGAKGLDERTAELRALLGRWRRFHGIEGDPGLAAAAKASARQAALLTGPWRLNLQLDGQAPWQYTAQVLPKQLLAASHLTELAWLGRKRKPGLRGASTFALAVPGQLLLLALFDSKVRVRTPPELRGPPELRATVQRIVAQVEASGSFGEAAAALEDVPTHLRAMALTQFDQPEAELEFA
jgi:Fe-S-cluster containining protein